MILKYLLYVLIPLYFLLFIIINLLVLPTAGSILLVWTIVGTIITGVTFKIANYEYNYFVKNK